MSVQTERSQAEEFFGQQRRMNSRVLYETWIMGTILTLDAVSTMVLIALNRAKEVNPVMEFYVSQGLFWFFLVKVGLFAIAPLFILEYFRRRGKEPFVRQSLRLGIAAYLLIYVVCSIGLRI